MTGPTISVPLSRSGTASSCLAPSSKYYGITMLVITLLIVLGGNLLGAFSVGGQTGSIVFFTVGNVAGVILAIYGIYQCSRGYVQRMNGSKKEEIREIVKGAKAAYERGGDYSHGSFSGYAQSGMVNAVVAEFQVTRHNVDSVGQAVERVIDEHTVKGEKVFLRSEGRISSDDPSSAMTIRLEKLVPKS